MKTRSNVRAVPPFARGQDELVAGEVWLIPGEKMREFCRDLGFSDNAIEAHRTRWRRR